MLLLAGLVLAVAVAVAWLNRRNLAEQALTGWLDAKGIASEAQVEAIGPTTFAARLRIGDPAHPDFIAERTEVRYRMRLTGIDIVSVTLTKPVLRASLRQGQFSVGALDPLVKDFLAIPPRPEAVKPRIEVKGGLVMLATDYGPVRVSADAVVNDNQLITLSAAAAPARLRGPAFDVNLSRATLAVARKQGRGLVADLSADAKRGAFAGSQIDQARLSVKLDGPYPDLVRRLGEGPLTLDAKLEGRSLKTAAGRFEAPALSMMFTGRTSGWIEDLAIAGRTVAHMRASGGQVGETKLGGLRLAAVSEDLAWTRKGGDRLAGGVKLTVGAEDIRSGDLTLAALTASGAGPVVATTKALDVRLGGSLVGRGGWTGFGDAPELAALKRAARSFRIAAPAAGVRLKDGATTVVLPQPLRLTADGGGVVTLAARGSAPVFGPSGGAFRLRSSGGGLPDANVDVAELTLTEDGVAARGQLTAKASLGPVRDGEVQASGRVRAEGGGLTFIADRCITAKAARLDLDANDLKRLSGRLCPTGAPLLRMDGGGWRLDGRLEAVAGEAPFAQVKLAGLAGPVSASGRGRRTTAQARIAAARLEDTAPARRFNPLTLTGTVDLGGEALKVEADARLASGPAIGAVRIAHDLSSGRGSAMVDTDELHFTDGGLQPAQISPLAAAVGSPAVGIARFQGRFDWTAEGVTSGGTLSVPRLDFVSPAGAIEGLKGEIAFTSLAPLAAAPGQTLTAEKVDAIVPLTHVRARFGIAEEVLRIEAAEAQVGDGAIHAETLEIPMTPGAPIRGVLRLDGVQLHDLVEASPFGDKVELDAKVTGRLPFEANGAKVRIAGGELKAIQPGRLSIDRAALTGIQADGAMAAPAAAAPPDPNATFTDFAYQAMENLSFDTLEASVDSKADGRLGVLFHIIGKHDPPTRQQIRLSVMDLLRQRFLGKPLPLPSGTGVNLTLDTTLNLDDLLADYGEFQRLHGSGPVQP